MSNLGSCILALDTASRRGSVAIARDGRVAALWGLEADGQQSAVLWSDVDVLLTRSGLTVHDVTAFAVARGPGAFTGLRVGMAAAAGFARATGRPLYGATTLEVTARAGGAARRVWAVLNAYRNEVYAQEFTVTAGGSPEPLGEPIVEAPARAFARFGTGPLRVIGGGGEAYADALAGAAAALGEPFERARVASPVERGWQLAPAPPFLAADLALLVSDRIAERCEPGAVEPCYVRQSEAEINLNLGRLGPATPVRSR